MTTHNLATLSNNTSTRLTPNGVHSGMDITIQNTDADAYVYLGGEGVSSLDFGYRLSPGAAWSIELPGRDAIYAISDTNETVVALMSVSLEGAN
jgi:hypothetical protein